MLMYCQSSEGIEKSAIRASRRLTSLVLFPSRRLFPQLPAVENTVIHKSISVEIYFFRESNWIMSKWVLNNNYFFYEKSWFVVIFHDWNECKNTQINFSSQNFWVERNFFAYTNVRENKRFNSSFSISCRKSEDWMKLDNKTELPTEQNWICIEIFLILFMFCSPFTYTWFGKIFLA